MTRLELGFFLACALGTSACASLHEAKTPEGVDVSPLLALELRADEQLVDRIESLLGSDRNRKREGDADTLLFPSPYGRGVDGVYRGFEVSRHGSAEAALQEYTSYKSQFSSGGWKLYE